MPDNLEHLRWTRLEIEPPLRPRQGFGRRQRHRADPTGHAGGLLGEAQAAVTDSRAQRQAGGIDPARLLVLRMRFLDEAQRELLAQLGLEVVDEREVRLNVEDPYYEVTVEFASPAVRQGFLQYPDHGQWGVTGVTDVRAAGGVVDERRLTLRFADLNHARAFQQPGHAGCPIPVTVRGKEQKISTVTSTALSVQFPDQAAIDRFFAELHARRDGDTSSLALTGNQRADLFDALDQIDHRGPDDRRGQRLVHGGVPDDAEFYLDVDLWHPGASGLITMATAQFRSIVEATGGQLTGAVRPVMHTLLIARVKSNRRTLNALLNYDRVSRVDLPPRLEPVQFTIFNAGPAQAQPISIAPDGPLACVVDSGVVPGHPLLRDLVVESEDFASGEDSPFDRIGHGTHVAGIVAYGDTWALLQSGRPWEPKVRLLNAKVLRRIEEHGGQVAWPGFSDLERAEAQIEDAVRRFAGDPERRCKVFNLSLGNDALMVGRGHQLPWALMLDQLVRELDIVLVVSAGNVTPPGVPHAPTEADLRAGVREQLFTDNHALIDPACSVTALTVGAISRLEVAHNPAGGTGRPDPVGSPRDCPAPFTRTGVLAGNGTGPCRAVKPDVVAYGGNLSLLPQGRWRFNDPILGEPSLNFDHTNRLLSTATGTSVAAPYVTHVCALIEHRMRLLNGGTPVSANLVRALAAHGAVVPAPVEDWLSQGVTESVANRRILRAVGYGKPDPYRCCYSDNNRAVLYAEDELAERCFHLYRFGLPADFLQVKGSRCIRVTLAYDSPVRGTRLEYLSRTMALRLYRGLSTEQIQQALAKSEGEVEAVELPSSAQRLTSPTLLEWSTLQSAECRSKDTRSFQNADDEEGVQTVWHILVHCKHRFPTPETEQRQGYALVLSIEHADETVQLYQPLRTQVTERVRARTRVTGR